MSVQIINSITKQLIIFPNPKPPFSPFMPDHLKKDGERYLAKLITLLPIFLMNQKKVQTI